MGFLLYAFKKNHRMKINHTYKIKGLDTEGRDRVHYIKRDFSKYLRTTAYTRQNDERIKGMGLW